MKSVFFPAPGRSLLVSAPTSEETYVFDAGDCLNLLGVFAGGAPSCHLDLRSRLFGRFRCDSSFLRPLEVKLIRSTRGSLCSFQKAETMFCRNQTARATVARGSALEMEIRRGKFRKSVFLDTSQVDGLLANYHTVSPHTHSRHTHIIGREALFTSLTDLSFFTN